MGRERDLRLQVYGGRRYLVHLAALGQTLLAKLPNDYRQVSEAVSFGTPLAASSNNLLHARYRKMVTDLLGLRLAEAGRLVEARVP